MSAPILSTRGPAIRRSAASATGRDCTTPSIAASAPRLATRVARLAAAPPSAAPSLRASSGPLICRHHPPNERRRWLGCPHPHSMGARSLALQSVSCEARRPMATTAADTGTPPEATVSPIAPGERAEQGRAARADAPRSCHADWTPATDRPDPIELLEEQAKTRVPELLPIRYGRMAASPFAFFRGGAYIMASDLANTPSTGLRVQLCGDAHLSNFGGFASPERDLLFDLHDFDETLPGPWEWDVKRLAASLSIAGRDRGFSVKQRRCIVMGAMAKYRETMQRLAEKGELAIWYERIDQAEINARFGTQATARKNKTFKRGVEKARRKDSM